MKAELLVSERHSLGEVEFAELKIWRVPRPVRGSTHRYKYSLALIVGRECVLRYDNEAGKGDHRHFRKLETAYLFTTPERLMEDFWSDVNEWSPE